MADPVIMTANERWKSISRTLLQLGAVVLSAAVVEIYRLGSMRLETAGWLMVSGGLMFSGWKLLILLESET